MWSISLHIQSNHSIGWPWPWPICCTRGSYGQYMLQFGSKMPIWHLTLSDLGWPWPWPWLTLCTRGSYNQYMLKYGKKKSIWLLILSDLGWPWPWLILRTRVSFNQYMLKYGQKCQFDLWPWMTLTFDLDLRCWRSFTQTSWLLFGVDTMNIHWNMAKKVNNLTLTLGDLGWPWPLTLTIGGAGNSYKPNGFCLESIRSISIEMWPKRSIWPWPWVTLVDLDLWPWPF